MIFLIVIGILLTCYVVNSTIPDENKVSYFIFVSVILALVVCSKLVSVLLN